MRFKAINQVQKALYSLPPWTFRRLTFTEAAKKYTTPNKLHRYFHTYFRAGCSSEVKGHRRYFSQERRGFGEDAFHGMWTTIFEEFRPRHCLEIGVYRGQVISLWAVLARERGIPAVVAGVSPFEPVGDSVSEYPSGISYLEDTLSSFRQLDLPDPLLVKGLSTSGQAAELFASRRWDLIYIDGSHDLDVVQQDYRNSVRALRSGGILVMDDAGIGSGFSPPFFSFIGHPGPSRVARDWAKRELRFLGAVGDNLVFMKEDEPEA